MKFEQTSLFYSASYLNLGVWSFVLEGYKPTTGHPWRRDWGKTSACFLMQLTRKTT